MEKHCSNQQCFKEKILQKKTQKKLEQNRGKKHYGNSQ